MLYFRMQKINIKLKKLGKRKIKTFEVSLTKEVHTLSDLITQMVQNEVEKFNDKRDNPQIISFLSNKTINTKAQEGKVNFGDISNPQKAIESEAIENALLAFTDGLFVVFIDDEEIKELKQNIKIDASSEVVFMRLTFLTGTYW